MLSRRSKARCRGAFESDPAGFGSRTVGGGPRPQRLATDSRARGVGSVDHFHHQLELLEHAGPKLVAPAYRLRSARSEANSAAVASSRPKLVLLRAVQDGQAADIDDVDGAHYARVGVIEPPEPPVSPAQTECRVGGVPSPAGAPALHLRPPPARGSRHHDRHPRRASRAAAGLDLHRDHGDCRPGPRRASSPTRARSKDSGGSPAGSRVTGIAQGDGRRGATEPDMVSGAAQVGLPRGVGRGRVRGHRARRPSPCPNVATATGG